MVFDFLVCFGLIGYAGIYLVHCLRKVLGGWGGGGLSILKGPQISDQK